MISRDSGSGKCRVSLVNPPSAPGTLANREGAAGMGVVQRDTVALGAEGATAFFYPPHTLATVAAHLRDADYGVRAFDGLVEEVSTAADADVIAVFVSYASLEMDLAFLAHLRQETDAKLVVFGPAMRFVADQVVKRAPVDAVVVGEVECFLASALESLEVAPARAVLADPSSGPHILTADRVGALCCDADGWVRDLDGLPFPAWDLLPYGRYPLLSVLSSRGCPDRCAYCPYAAAQGHRLRTRSVENVLAELAWLEQRFRPARVVFRDPVFAYDRQRVTALCEGVLRRGLRLRWECESRPEHFDAELLRLMLRAGCQCIKIGLETTDEFLLSKLRRIASAEEAGAYLQHVAQVVRACLDLGVQCRLFVMAGLPGQDTEAAVRTRDFVARLRPTALHVKALEKYPGLDPMVEQSELQGVAAEMAILQQAQEGIRRHTSPALLARGKRWLSGRLKHWL